MGLEGETRCKRTLPARKGVGYLTTEGVQLRGGVNDRSRQKACTTGRRARKGGGQWDPRRRPRDLSHHQLRPQTPLQGALGDLKAQLP